MARGLHVHGLFLISRKGIFWVSSHVFMFFILTLFHVTVNSMLVCVLCIFDELLISEYVASGPTLSCTLELHQN